MKHVKRNLAYLTDTLDKKTKVIKSVANALKQKVVGVDGDSAVLHNSKIDVVFSLSGQLPEVAISPSNFVYYWCRTKLTGFKADKSDVPETPEPPVDLDAPPIVSFMLSQSDCNHLHNMLPLCTDNRGSMGVYITPEGFLASDGNLTFWQDREFKGLKNSYVLPTDLWRLLSKFPDNYECSLWEDSMTLTSKSFDIYVKISETSKDWGGTVEGVKREGMVNEELLKSLSTSKIKTVCQVREGDATTISYPSLHKTISVKDLLKVRGDVKFCVHSLNKAISFAQSSDVEVYDNCLYIDGVNRTAKLSL